MTRKTTVHVVLASPNGAINVYMCAWSCLDDLQEMLSMLRPGTLISVFACESNTLHWMHRTQTSEEKRWARRALGAAQ